MKLQGSIKTETLNLFIEGRKRLLLNYQLLPLENLIQHYHTELSIGGTLEKLCIESVYLTMRLFLYVCFFIKETCKINGILDIKSSFFSNQEVLFVITVTSW